VGWPDYRWHRASVRHLLLQGSNGRWTMLQQDRDSQMTPPRDDGASKTCSEADVDGNEVLKERATV
jgi:hypothetical protein